ncbi:hypothetical protein ILUMI_06692 [Ignelater luminosus]|uniref:Uncharacterized protein n=1 Tax=Ignelater luminosus TaxID=2038154 RepID=A0A8K0D7X2_IGNLU|nr:hypothetical protein ILUMI_06692 [Ignelater luminosus]
MEETEILKELVKMRADLQKYEELKKYEHMNRRRPVQDDTGREEGTSSKNEGGQAERTQSIHKQNNKLGLLMLGVSTSERENMNLILAYVPNENECAEGKDEFYEKLQEALDKTKI